MSITVRDAMVPAESRRSDQPLSDALRLMDEKGFDQVPVTEGDDGPLCGVVSYRFMREDKISYKFGPAPNQPISESMRPIDQLPDGMVSESGDTPVDQDLLDYYYKNDFILVVNVQNHLQGIAQLWDVAHKLLTHSS